MSYSIIGLFDSKSDAQAAQADLIQLGVPAGDINIKAELSSETTASASTSTTGAGSKGIWSDIKDFFTGDDDSHYGDYYAEGTRRGSTLMTANVSEQLADRAIDVLHAHNVVDIDNRAAEWSKEGWSGYRDTATTATTATTAGTSAAALATGAVGTTNTTAVKSTTGRAVTADSATPPVSLQETEESLSVGKRQVSRGGVRIVRRVIERPVEENVTLHEERVNVARRVVDRPLTGAEADAAFTEKSLELVETGEEAVKAKTARVVGEVVIDKTGTDRVEKVGDTLRKTEVEVERVPGQTTEKSAVTQTKTVDADSVSTASTTKKVSQ